MKELYRSACERIARSIYNRFCFKHEERECQVDGAYIWPRHAALAYKVATWLDQRAW